jgi:hypothetical protein
MIAEMLGGGVRKVGRNGDLINTDPWCYRNVGSSKCLNSFDGVLPGVFDEASYNAQAQLISQVFSGLLAASFSVQELRQMLGQTEHIWI